MIIFRQNWGSYLPLPPFLTMVIPKENIPYIAFYQKVVFDFRSERIITRKSSKPVMRYVALLNKKPGIAASIHKVCLIDKKMT